LFRYYYQLFENELPNPVNLLAGNFDLAFVLIYLFPLLLIVFCYGLFSAEREKYCTFSAWPRLYF
jgi:ABC-2 type transport system permease protein